MSSLILQSQESGVRYTVEKREQAVRYGTFPTERLAFPFRGGSRKHSFFTNIFKYLSCWDDTATAGTSPKCLWGVWVQSLGLEQDQEGGGGEVLGQFLYCFFSSELQLGKANSSKRTAFNQCDVHLWIGGVHAKVFYRKNLPFLGDHEMLYVIWAEESQTP